MSRRIPAFFAFPVQCLFLKQPFLLAPCLSLALSLTLSLALPLPAGAETLLWPASGSLRECPEFMDMALYPDMHAGNTVIIQDDVPGDVAGAVAYAPLNPPRNAVEALALASALPRGNGTARRNTVLVQRGVVEGFVDGGWSGMGPAQDNILIVSGGTVRKLARGGGSNGGPAAGNVLHMAAGSVEGSAIGGSSLRDAASGNTLTLSGGSVRDAVVGGSSSFGPAESNTVYMGGGRASSVVGGSSGHGNVQGNAVHVHGGVVTRDIVGGETTNGELATQNTVTLGRHAQLSPEVRVFGGLKALPPGMEPGSGPASALPSLPSPMTTGKEPAAPPAAYTGSQDKDSQGRGSRDTGRNEFLFKGNVLKVQWQGRLRGVHNFQYWEFFLPEQFQPGDTLLTVDEEVDLRQCVLRLVGVLSDESALAAPQGLASWQPGDSATLVRAPALLTEGAGLPPATLTLHSPQRRMAFTLELDDVQKPTAVLLRLARVTPVPSVPSM